MNRWRVGLFCAGMGCVGAACTTTTFFPKHRAAIVKRATTKPEAEPGVQAGAFEVMKIRLERALRHECRRAAVAEESASIVAWRRFQRAAETSDHLADSLPYRFDVSRRLVDSYWCAVITI